MKIFKMASGFTLLEVMVAVAIIAMAMVAAIGSQSQSVSLASEAKFATTAAFLAQGKMAEIEASDPDDLSSDSGNFGDDFPGYRWESDVIDATLEGIDEISDYVKKYSVNVYWGEGNTYQYRLDSFYYVPKSEK